jgi:hypothetical protein
VNYIVNNNLGVIDNAHLAWADQLKDGVRHGKCLKLAELHSLAVDFPKTGVPAKMDRRLRPRSYPHFMEKVDKASYHSESVLGKIYDRITEFEFTPDTDARLNEALLVDGHELYHDEARRVKREYDEAVLSVMNQFGIATEWEAVSGWIVQFNTLLSKRDFHLREQVMELKRNLFIRQMNHLHRLIWKMHQGVSMFVWKIWQSEHRSSIHRNLTNPAPEHGLKKILKPCAVKPLPGILSHTIRMNVSFLRDIAICFRSLGLCMIIYAI